MKAIIYYQEQKGNGTLEFEPFILSGSNEWQKEHLQKFGHNGPICMDAAFGTKSPKVSLWSL